MKLKIYMRIPTAMNHMNQIILTIAVIVLAIPGFSQEKNWSVQLSTGPTIHYGDIMDHELFFPATDNNKAWNFSGAFALERRLNPYLSVRGQLLYGKLGGTRSSVTNPRYFEADIFDYSVQARIDLLNLFTNNNTNRNYNIYGLLGVGLSNWETDLINAKNNNILSRSGGVDVGMLKMTTEGFIPAGGGISYGLNNNFTLNLESTMRIANSDDMDAQKSGDSQYDMYSFTSLGLSYSFGGKQSKQSARMDYNSDPLIKQKTDSVSVPGEKTIEKEKSFFEAEIVSEMPEQVDAGQSYEVNIRINKGNLSGPATLRQVFPANFTVDPLKMENGDYNFANQVLTLNWKKLPADNKINLTYRVDTEDVEEGTYPISGIFTYTQNTQSKLLSFKNSIKVIAHKQLEEKKNYQVDDRIDENTIFRVQIRAKYKQKMSIPKLKERFNIDEKIYEDRNAGYYIYTVGRFSTYEEAKQKREILNNKHGIPDAFVVAFVNGKRLDELKNVDQFYSP